MAADRRHVSLRLRRPGHDLHHLADNRYLGARIRSQGPRILRQVRPFGRY